MKINKKLFLSKLQNGRRFLYTVSKKAELQPMLLKDIYIKEIVYFIENGTYKNKEIYEQLKSVNIIVSDNNKEYDMNFDVVKGKSYLTSAAYKTLTPLNAKIELTYNCQLKCSYCAMLSSKSAEMDTTEIINILDQLKDMGVIKLSITGGEVFLRNDILKIIKYANNLGFIVIVQTNALLITLEQMKILKKFGNVFLKISFHSLKKKVFDKFVGVEGSYKKLKNQLIALQDMSVNFVLVYNITNRNSSEYHDIINFFRNSGYEYIINSDIFPNVEDSSKSNQEFVCNNNSILLSHYREYYKDKDKDYLSKVKCSAAILRMRIEPNGDVNQCGQIRDSLGNVRNDSIKSIWYNQKSTRLRKSKLFTVREECSECKHVKYCNKCNAFYHYDNNWKEVKKSYCTGAEIINLIMNESNS